MKAKGKRGMTGSRVWQSRAFRCETPIDEVTRAGLRRPTMSGMARERRVETGEILFTTDAEPTPCIFVGVTPGGHVWVVHNASQFDESARQLGAMWERHVAAVLSAEAAERAARKGGA